jgi:predicted AlkP superfamily pyrophosphatase or phosphodiesterase
VASTAAALAAERRALALVYTGDLDATGHVWGCTSPAWRFQLGHVDRLAEQLAGALPSGTTLYVTADHGMVDVPPGQRIDADTVTELRAGVALLGGEARARHVYAQPGAEADVLATWRSVLGDSAWVVSRDEAVDAGWFGPVDSRTAARIGDVVAAARARSAVVATQTEPRESALVGMHGSLTPAEQRVPLLSHVA